MSSVIESTTQAFLKPIEKYLQDETVTEVMINGPDDIYIERSGRLFKTDSRFESSDQLMAMVRNVAQFVGRRIDEDVPILDARLPDGSRIHVVIPPISKIGTVMSIRKFSEDKLNMKELIEIGCLTIDMGRFIHACVQLKKNMIISGGTSSGKTTLLNVISTFIPEDQRIVVIEDSSELQLQQPHVLRMETRTANKQGKGEITMRDLVKSALRLRPDRIVIGEVRGEEALDLLQAMNTGHDGSMASLHSNNPRQSISRLETMVMMNKLDLPFIAIKTQIASAVDIIIHASRLRDGSRRITHISELVDLDENGQYILNDLFHLQILKTGDDQQLITEHIATGKLPSFLDDAKRQGYVITEKLFHPAAPQKNTKDQKP